MKFVTVIGTVYIMTFAAATKPLYYGQQTKIATPKFTNRQARLYNANSLIPAISDVYIKIENPQHIYPATEGVTSETNKPLKIDANALLETNNNVNFQQNMNLRSFFRIRRSVESNQIKDHVPIITRNGVPVDTPEVQLAKVQHMIAHYHANSNQHGAESNIQFIHPIEVKSRYNPKEHIPHIRPNGVPLDTPEVQIERAKHLAVHAKAKMRHPKKYTPISRFENEILPKEETVEFKFDMEHPQHHEYREVEFIEQAISDPQQYREEFHPVIIQTVPYYIQFSVEPSNQENHLEG